jgi:hypothetical protein
MSERTASGLKRVVLSIFSSPKVLQQEKDSRSVRVGVRRDWNRLTFWQHRLHLNETTQRVCQLVHDRFVIVLLRGVATSLGKQVAADVVHRANLSRYDRSWYDILSQSTPVKITGSVQKTSFPVKNTNRRKSPNWHARCFVFFSETKTMR